MPSLWLARALGLTAWQDTGQAVKSLTVSDRLGQPPTARQHCTACYAPAWPLAAPLAMQHHLRFGCALPACGRSPGVCLIPEFGPCPFRVHRSKLRSTLCCARSPSRFLRSARPARHCELRPLPGQRGCCAGCCAERALWLLRAAADGAARTGGEQGSWGRLGRRQGALQEAARSCMLHVCFSV